MDSKLTLLVGPPASGKTTWSCEQIHRGARCDVIYINQDIQGEGHLELFHESIRQGDSIIVDRMNFNNKQRNRYLDVAKAAGYETEIVVFHIPRDVCLERCLDRKDHQTIKDGVSAGRAISHFFRNYERVEDSEADTVIRLGWERRHKQTCVISDLDGTLANVDHRLHFVAHEKSKDKNWTEFFENMIYDTVNPWCKEILQQMSAEYSIVYSTGRPEEYRLQTERWLKDNRMWFDGCYLFMRTKGGYQKDDLVKVTMLDFEIKTRFSDVLFIIDDRASVVEAWRRHGYTVLQCAKGEF